MKTPTSTVPPTDCHAQPLLFADLGSRQVVADFTGGYLSSDLSADRQTAARCSCAN